jgi:6-phosphogluconolactonase (cycloisomerase 2 family)
VGIDTDIIYIGATTEKCLSKKISYLRFKLKNNKINDKRLVDLMKNNYFETHLLELYPCNNKDELKTRIFFHIDEYKKSI